MTKAMRIGSLCTGFGGLDMAVEDVFGATTAWTSDTDPGASKIIAHRYPEAPNLGDLTKIDWSEVEPVDILAAGWPCQPFSQAGKQKGADDARAIWPEVARAVRALRPRYVVLENVSAIASVRTGPELCRAVASLAEIGYVGSWLCLRASDVGAPHRRERIFIVAADSRGEAGGLGAGLRQGGTSEVGRGRPDDGAGAARLLPTPNARNSNDGEGFETWEARRRVIKGQGINGNGAGMPLAIAVQLLPTPRATDGTKGGPNQRGSSGDLMMPSAVQPDRFAEYSEAITRWAGILRRPAPDPTVKKRLNPAFVEWMQGCPEGWVTEVPDLTRPAQLKALGNGVVRQQASAAIRYITEGNTA